MTRQKSFKTRVRARMDKTGESYTTARRQLLDKARSASGTAATAEQTAASAQSAAPVPATASAAPAPATAPATGPATTRRPSGAIKALQHSDASVRERTGRGWDEWFSLLDVWGATSRTHTEIARWLVAEHEVEGWWAQSLAVGYEQARGMRAPGQGSDGYFSATGSKTVSVSVERLFDAFADPDVRERWLPGVEVRVRTATVPKSFRADWEGSTRIEVGFTAKGDAKAQVAVGHQKLADADEAARMKAYWRDRLAALKRLLEA